MRSTRNCWFESVRFRMAAIYTLSVALVSGVIFFGVYEVELYSASHHAGFALSDAGHQHLVDYHVAQIGRILFCAWLALVAFSAFVGFFFAPFITRAADEAMDNLSRAADAIAHDLKAPLTRLRVRSEMTAAAEGPDAPFAAAVATDTSSMLSLVNTLLDIARLECEGSVGEESVDLKALALDVEDLFRPLAENAGLTLDVSLPEGAVVVRGHHGKLMQVVGNLVDNAIKYTPKGGTVMVTLTQMSNEARLTVADTGVGIPDESRAHLFEPFYRAKNAPSAGNGLGLAFVKAVVTAAGGTVSFESNSDHGTIFTVCFPLDSGALRFLR